MARDLTKFGRNFLLSLGGEGVQSAFHFLLNLVLIRLLAPYDFGLFAIAFILGGISLTYGNALISVPATVRLARQKRDNTANYLDVVFGTIALLISVAIALIASAALWLITGSGVEALASGAFVGLWTLRNHVRSMMFARKAMAAAVLSDFGYSASGISLIAGILFMGRVTDVTNVLAALAVANLLGICVALRSSHRRVRVSFRKGVWRRYRDIWPDVAWSLFGTTTGNIQGQGLMFLVASVAGPAAYAPIAAGMVLFSPLRPAISAFVNVFRTDFVAALAERRLHHLVMVVYAVCGVIVLACLAIAGVIWVAWPYLDAHLFGAKFADAPMSLIVTLSGISAMIFLTYTVPLTLVQAAGQFRSIAAATATGGIVGLSCISILLAKVSVVWSLAGAAAGEIACGIFLSIVAWQILREPAVKAVPSINSMTRARGIGV